MILVQRLLKYGLDNYDCDNQDSNFNRQFEDFIRSFSRAYEALRDLREHSLTKSMSIVDIYGSIRRLTKTVSDRVHFFRRTTQRTTG